MARTIEASKARSEFADTLNAVAYGEERFVLVRRGKAVAALVPVEDLALLEEMEDRDDVRAARKALAEARKRGTVRWEDIKAELAL
ncbi:MAG: type II toxin-antitoxin system Phd/YefM family antitoxin [Planctomycetes bacterium]|nr:type II toxin-antitoxin system Phd/YefM family antitoxin [Planctomycetota bacterium]